jgi:Ni,Fe-hydrogenase maturation factor
MERSDDLSGRDPQTAAERGLEISDHQTGGSGHGYSKGRSYGTAAGLIAGDRTASQLVVGVGYPYLSDLAVGNVVADRVVEWDLPEVAVADCSHTPIAAYQTITKGEYDNVVIVGARKRGDGLNTGTPSNDPGAIHTYPTETIDVPEDDIVDRIAECAMGSNTIENVVIITKALGEFPSGSMVIDIEPEYDSWGYAIEEFSPAVSDSFDQLVDLVLDELQTNYSSSE